MDKNEISFENLPKAVAHLHANTMIEVLPSAGSLLNVHGEDYAETAFRRRLRALQKKRRGGECDLWVNGQKVG